MDAGASAPRGQGRRQKEVRPWQITARFERVSGCMFEMTLLSPPCFPQRLRTGGGRQLVLCSHAGDLLPLLVTVPSYDGPNYVDPLQRAVDRDSEALQFVNKPLVLDYLQHVKFNCGLPHWASRKPDLASINEGFYTFYDFDEYDLSMLSEKSLNSPKHKGASPEAWDTRLLR